MHESSVLFPTRQGNKSRGDVKHPKYGGLFQSRPTLAEFLMIINGSLNFTRSDEQKNIVTQLNRSDMEIVMSISVEI
jgi:hypothetical protein